MIQFVCCSSYYNQGEVKDYEGNECEWPIFYTFLIIDGVFKTNTEQIEEYQAELRKCMYADANGGEWTQSIIEIPQISTDFQFSQIP